jgi:hypothetical protein
MGGEDFVFEYTPAADISVSITLTNTLTWTGVFVTDGCPDVGSCVTSATASGGNPVITSVALTGGVTYYIIVDTWPTPDCTPFDISIATVAGPPANNNCSGATAIGEVTNLAFDNTLATSSGVTNGCGSPGHDLWYAYTATSSGSATISLCGSGFDTILGIFDSCGGAELACNDDNGPACTGTESSLTLAVTGGTTYYIQVGGYSSYAGAGVLSVSLAK